ncbi:MAG: hypothetical protein J6J18_13470 [Oscillospiraceae bacterium]|nr:hypothetical protein [Oscillospiraceae bacterium]MBP3672750.1 hypothetical protein [Oscillospiraceae bacterium]MBP3674831.1 hypothetical protein [Oscillospiraceae bacterium]
MDESVLAALITGLLSLAGVMLSNLLSDRRRENALRTAQAVTDTRLEELTREVRQHNNFAQRMPVVEEQIKAIHHRLEDLETGGKSK